MDLSAINQKIKNVRRRNGELEFNEEQANANPFEQFIDWFNEALMSEDHDPSAVVLATIDKQGWPDTRVVLLKELKQGQLIFYTNYDSHKAKQLEKMNIAALNFYWSKYSRQVRIRGKVEKVARADSEKYFASRPHQTQVGAHAWVQSTKVESREQMDKQIEHIATQFADKQIPCPENWGGFVVTPFEYEFFQGRQWRRHDRLLYTLENNQWKRVRLAP